MAKVQVITTKVEVDDSSWKEWQATVNETARDHQEAERVITRSNKKIESSTEKTGKKIQDTSKKSASGIGSITKAFGQFQNLLVGGAIVGALQQIVSFLSIAAQSALEFEKSLASLSAITGATGADLEAFSKSAQDFTLEITKANGEVVKFQEAPTAVLRAFELVGSARPQLLKSREALEEVTKQALILSRASGLSLEDSVRSLTTVLNQFNADASQTSSIINILGEGSKLGAAPIGAISEAVKEFGTSANSANISIPETVALVEALADKSIQGSRAGIQLRNILTLLQKGADETNPAIVGLDQALANLEAQNLSAADITKRFGLENQEAAKILIQNRSRVNDLSAALSNQGLNTAVEQAGIRLSTTAAQAESLQNQIEANRVEIGEKFLPIQLELTKAQLEFFNALSAVIKEGEAFRNEFRGVNEIVGILGNSLSGVNSLFKSLGIEINAARVVAKVLGRVISNALGFGLVEQLGRSIATTKRLFNQFREFLGFAQERTVEVVEITEEHILFQRQVTEAVKQTTEATTTLSEKEQEAAQKRREDLQEQIAALRAQSELYQADAEERLNIQRDREIRELEQSRDFQELLASDAETANALIEQIREKYSILQSERLAKERKAAEESAKALAEFGAQLNAMQDAQQEERLANRLAQIERSAAEERLLASQRIEDAEVFSATIEQIEIERLQLLLEARRQFGLDTLEIEQQLADARRAIRDKATEETIKADKNSLDTFLGNAQKSISATANFLNLINERQLQAAEGNDEKLKQIRRRQFERNKAIGLAEVAVNTAIAVSQALATPFLIPFILAQGIAQAAVIAAQQPPVFHKGTDFATASGNPREFGAVIERGERIIDADTNRTYKADLDDVHNALKVGAVPQGLLSDAIRGANVRAEIHTLSSAPVIDYAKLAKAVVAEKYESEFEMRELLAGMQINTDDFARTVAQEIVRQQKWGR